MKTTAIQFVSYGNIGLVQLRAEPKSTFIFKPGAPEMISGGLKIIEAAKEGVVGNLIAENNTEFFLLLSDGDVLIGAKQNRIVNRSMLLAPGSKTVIDVSCVERLRWRYTSGEFSSSDSSADHDLRRAKAEAMSNRRCQEQEVARDTQQKVWSHINSEMRDIDFANSTENYIDLAKHSKVIKEKERRFPDFRLEQGCNGLAVIADGKIRCIDIFGTDAVFSHYFPLLRDAAFSRARATGKVTAVDIHEAFYKVVDALDALEAAERKNDLKYSGEGMMSIAQSDGLIGFDLTMTGQPVHLVVFGG